MSQQEGMEVSHIYLYIKRTVPITGN